MYKHLYSVHARRVYIAKLIDYTGPVYVSKYRKYWTIRKNYLICGSYSINSDIQVLPLSVQYHKHVVLYK